MGSIKNISQDEFRPSLLSETLWIDVRAPLEFEQGAIPGAVLAPLINNEERHLVGLCYKQKGQEKAIELGHQLVSGSVREQRTQNWLFLVSQARSQNKKVIIYCFRGGLRSQTVQKWLLELGCEVPLVVGGYKLVRQFLIQELQDCIKNIELEVVGGPTGSGKTKFLYESGRPFLDLEKWACHRGSAFGATRFPQPSPANFENRLAVELMRLTEKQSDRLTGQIITQRSRQLDRVLIEAESRLIGRAVVPDALFSKMQSSPRFDIDPGLEKRIENIFQDYILDGVIGQDKDPAGFEFFKKGVRNLMPKLGGPRVQEILNDLNLCEEEFNQQKNLETNRIWIRKLLEWYYDPLYKKSAEFWARAGTSGSLK